MTRIPSTAPLCTSSDLGLRGRIEMYRRILLGINKI
jgi:hypothetical protein